MILESVEAMDLMIGNTWYKKRGEHLITYASGGARSQINYLLTRREHKHIVKDYKIIPGEAVVSQHKLVVMELRTIKKEQVEEDRKDKIMEVERWSNSM